ncbi:MAG: DUF4422 domain-containing protein [Clostridia bacterium]|nr:DUF4422 domain-containing protein [Clostridia bacterium]
MGRADITLYVAAYKDADVHKDRTVIGSGLHKPIKNADLYDDTGDNISAKNGSFCELTALYWIWKNDSSAYVGLEHYRRFFCGKSVFKQNILSKESILSLLEGCDVILPKKHKVAKDVYRHYAKNHVKGDLDECGRIIREMHPGYAADFDKVMASKYCSLYNMFIIKRELLNSYCGWLFPILFELEKRIDLSARTAYQQRAFGFAAERLFNVWLEHNNPKTIYKDVYTTGDIPVFVKAKTCCLNIIKSFT